MSESDGRLCHPVCWYKAAQIYPSLPVISHNPVHAFAWHLSWKEKKMHLKVAAKIGFVERRMNTAPEKVLTAVWTDGDIWYFLGIALTQLVLNIVATLLNLNIRMLIRRKNNNF